MERDKEDWSLWRNSLDEEYSVQHVKMAVNLQDSTNQQFSRFHWNSWAIPKVNLFV
ncbi:hypothetical protein HanRHA438_Chr08g0328341 [Helianthus annuus]|nr:hypothetical protein HanRHA438_Chr08g0328341 [Helianthus annuus]